MARIRTTSKKWLEIVRKRFLRSSSSNNNTNGNRNTASNFVLLSNSCSSPDDDNHNDSKTRRITDDDDDEMGVLEEMTRGISFPPNKKFSKEDISAIKIQAVFRGHLARRAYRALRSLVKLQALVRGVYVRKQSRIALHCMKALIRLQIRIRARQLLEDATTTTQSIH